MHTRRELLPSQEGAALIEASIDLLEIGLVSSCSERKGQAWNRDTQNAFFRYDGLSDFTLAAFPCSSLLVNLLGNHGAHSR